jgi:DNA-binding winged helix-turn-helix (wHTH) protein
MPWRSFASHLAVKNRARTRNHLVYTLFNATVKPDPLNRVRLGGFEVDLKSGELRSFGTEGENKVVLREQPFQVLRMLIDRGGELVTREEIKKGLWPNDTTVDFDHSINVAIGILRRALGDSADSPRYIETLARRGYRLLVTPEWPGSATDSAGSRRYEPVAEMRADLTRVGMATQSPRRRVRRWFAAAALLVLVATGLRLYWGLRPCPRFCSATVVAFASTTVG